jgi:carboxyl-terminal processing protease
LNRSYAQRLKSDPVLTKFVDETAEVRKSMHDTKISLNETIRKKEIDEAEKKAAANKLNTKIAGKESPKTSDLNELTDEYLREGLLVLGDLITSKIG